MFVFCELCSAIFHLGSEFIQGLDLTFILGTGMFRFTRAKGPSLDVRGESSAFHMSNGLGHPSCEVAKNMGLICA